MTKRLLSRIVGATILGLLLNATPGHAQLTRTWVSAAGDDSNTCALSDPCQTFAGALAKTAAGGYIGVLGPGGYGHVVIDKSVTIDGGGAAIASVLETVPNASAIYITAGNTDVVTLRNLSLVGGKKSLNGIDLVTAAALHVENCIISDFVGWGIAIEPGTTNLDVTVSVENTLITGNGYNSNNIASTSGGAIGIMPGHAWVRARLNQVRVDSNLRGIMADGSHGAASYYIRVLAQNSSSSFNQFAGFAAVASPPMEVTMALDRITAASNGDTGVEANGAGAGIVISNSTVTLNGGAGLSEKASGTIADLTTNTIHSNAGINFFQEKGL